MCLSVAIFSFIQIPLFTHHQPFLTGITLVMAVNKQYVPAILVVFRLVPGDWSF